MDDISIITLVLGAQGLTVALLIMFRQTIWKCPLGRCCQIAYPVEKVKEIEKV